MPDVSRREFCACMAAVAAATHLAKGQEAGEFNPVKPAEESASFRDWLKNVAVDQPITYRGADLEQIALPLGGIGSGYVAIGGRGHLAEWQIFNNVNKRAQVPDSFFAVRVKGAGDAVARVLQTQAPEGLPGVPDIEFRGEYPFAELSYLDDALPAKVRLTAWNPMIPLNEDDSGIPGCLFTFHAENPTAEPLEVSLLASLQNAVGYTGYGGYQGRNHPGFGGNRAATSNEAGLTSVHLAAEPGDAPKLGREVRLFSLDRDDEMRVIAGLQKGGLGGRGEVPNADGLSTFEVLWLDNAAERLPDNSLAEVLTAVKRGATLLLTGGARSLLSKAAAANVSLRAEAGAKPPEVVFADFEGGTYEGWEVTGDAFGDAPAGGTLPGQQAVSGFEGKGLVNTFLSGDGTTGRARSKTFTIEHRYIHFRIGGGAHRGETCLNLLVDGKVVHSATGRNDERLEPASWDVQNLRGKTAQLEIVDANTGGWGHINVDQIVFSDGPLGPSPELAQDLSDAMPYLLDGADWTPGEVTAKPVGDAPPSLGQGTALPGYVRLANVQLKPGARVAATVADGAPLLAVRRYGQGKVVVFAAPVEGGSPRWAEHGRLLGELIAWSVGTTYTPATGLPATGPFYGSLALATDAAETTVDAGWTELAALWQDFTADGQLEARPTSDPTPAGETHNVAVCANLRVPPGESREVTFYLGWHFPNQFRRFWGPPYEIRVGNAYNRRFRDAAQVVAYLHAQRERLERETRAFHDAMYDSTLPYWLIDCLTSQAAIARTQTTMWFEDDYFGGFEGCGGGEGCCPLNCTHVWNYAQSVAGLYPGMERRVRREDFGYQLSDAGVISFRHMYPHTFRPWFAEAVDGQCGTVMKAWREHLRSADDSFLKDVWPGVRKALLYLLEQRDSDGDGILDGSQHHTYDVNMLGVSMFIQSLWLGALRAGERMASAMNDPGLAERCLATFEKASPALDQMLWQGEYYQQVYDAEGHTVHQHGPGCLADQVVGQWWAHQLDLGYLLPPERVKQALRSVYHYNLREDFNGFRQIPRRFAFDDEKGLLICTWPNGGRPETPILYADEVWTGVEYQVAAHLLHEGFLTEGLAVALAARERYRGHNRNPWNEIECGDNYARAMSSWSLLLAAQGFIYDGPAGRIGFVPKLSPDDHRSFFTAAEGWGRFTSRREGDQRHHTIEVVYGKLEVAELVLPAGTTATVTLGDQAVPATAEMRDGRLVVRLDRRATVAAGQALKAAVGGAA